MDTDDGGSSRHALQVSTYAFLSPLYLDQARGYVNNAKILATHLIPIGSQSSPDSASYQTLYVIDQPLEFAYVSHRVQLRSPAVSSRKSGSTTVKRSLTLDDLLGSSDGSQAAYEFHERFSGLQTNQAQVDLYHTRQFKGIKQQLEHIQLARQDFDLEQRLGRAIRQLPQLRGKFYHLNETHQSAYNTYFLPMNTNDQLDTLLDLSPQQLAATLEAHMIPNQVLFTRSMGLGVSYPISGRSLIGSQHVSLSLAKTLPVPQDATTGHHHQQDYPAVDYESRKYLATPLLLQCQCTGSAADSCRPGITSAELLVANIPLSNGVLHLIKKPILLTDSRVLDYLNDNDNQLSQIVDAIGSRTGNTAIATSSNTHEQPLPVRLNRFRELLMGERQLLATISMDSVGSNRTILAPSDEAFGRLRYDLRALIQGDESLIPKHWDSSYKQDLLERLIKRHVISQQTLTTDQIGTNGLQLVSDNGKLLNFSKRRASGENNDADYQVDCDQTRARVLHHDLIGTNGVIHIIDRVLGEEEETVHSLLKSIVLKFNHSLALNQLDDSSSSGAGGDSLGQLIQSNIRNQQQQSSQDMMISSPPSVNSINAEDSESLQSRRQPLAASSRADPRELSAISRAIGQYLDDLAANNRRQLQLLSSSVNISYQLARLTSLAEGQDDWNDKFKQQDRLFTYFVPSDLAWIRLQQAQPELHKPLMHFLESQQQQQQSGGDEITNNNSIYASEQQQSSQSDSSPKSSPAAQRSESSHRLCQVSSVLEINGWFVCELLIRFACALLLPLVVPNLFARTLIRFFHLNCESECSNKHLLQSR